MKIKDLVGVQPAEQSRVTVMARTSFQALLEPKPNRFDPTKEPKYECTFIIKLKDVDSVNAVKAAILCAYKKGKAKHGNAWKPSEGKIPLRYGEDNHENRTEFEDSVYFTARDAIKPMVVDRNKQPITDHEQIYSGCYGYAVVEFYPYKSGNGGISCSLQGFMKIADGENLEYSRDTSAFFNDVQTDLH